MPEQGGGKGFGRLPFNYRGQLASASGHVARSNDVQLRCPFWTPVRDQEAGLQRDYCICIICDCVPRNFWPTYEDSVRRSLLPPRPTSAATTFLLCLQRTLRESLCTWLVFTGWQLSFLERTISSIPLFSFFLSALRLFHPPILRLLPPRSSIPLLDSSPPRIAPVSQPKGEEAGQPSILRRVIVRPLSTQARQIRVGMGFLTIGTASNEGRFPLKLGKRWKRGSTLRLTFQ